MEKANNITVTGGEKKGKTGGTRKEPAGNINSLEHVLWELDIVNAKRAAEGKKPLSYGNYVSMRDKK